MCVDMQAVRWARALFGGLQTLRSRTCICIDDHCLPDVAGIRRLLYSILTGKKGCELVV